jgi:hypothetical protein
MPPAGVPQNSTMAIVSLVAGVLGWVLIPILGPIVAVITGHMAQGQIKGSNGALRGRGLAIAGLILGYAQIVLLAAMICVVVILVLLGPVIGHVFSSITPSI